MSSLTKIVFAFFATVFFSAAQAQNCAVNPWFDGCEIAEYQQNVLFHIDTAGVIRDLAGWTSVGIYGTAIIGTTYFGSRIQVSKPAVTNCRAR